MKGYVLGLLFMMASLGCFAGLAEGEAAYDNEDVSCPVSKDKFI